MQLTRPHPDPFPQAGEGISGLLFAALALPGVWVAPPAQAQGAPADGVISLRHLHYRDSQPGLKRITVDSPSLYVLAPLSPQWAAEGTLVVDAVSGATPRYHTAVSGASRMSERRTAGDVKLTRYRERSSYAFRLAHSNERDYDSTALSATAALSSDDHNTTVNAGVAYAYDRIGSVNDEALQERRRTPELIAGVTQVLSTTDIVQLNLTHAAGRGYYSDPYKSLDMRPRKRNQSALLGRWNHHFASNGTTLRASYRYYRDSFRIRAHTLQTEWVLPLGSAVKLAPLLRLYSQSAASFYYDPVYDALLGAPFPAGYDPANPPRHLSADQRLSAFGAVTLGVKAEYVVSPQWTIDAKLEVYQQRGEWRIGGSGSPGLEPFRASFVQFGASRRF